MFGIIVALSVAVLVLAALVYLLGRQVQSYRVEVAACQALTEHCQASVESYQGHYNRMYENTNRRLSEHITSPMHRR